MLNLVDSLFIVGVLIQLSSLGDFLIRESQKKVIHRKLELFKKNLEHANPLKYYYLAFETKRLRVLIITLIVLFSCLILINQLYVFSNYDIIIPISHFIPAKYTKLVIVSVPFIFAAETLIVFEYIGMSLLYWMVKVKRWKIFLAKYLIIFVSFNLFFILPFALAADITEETKSILNLPLLLYLSALLISGVPFVIWTIVLAGFIFILYGVILITINFLILVLRWLLVRVVEYNKGVVAAISLLITFLLGVISLILKN